MESQKHATRETMSMNDETMNNGFERKKDIYMLKSPLEARSEHGSKFPIWAEPFPIQIFVF